MIPKWSTTWSEKWISRYVGLARHVADWSLDPSTRVGAVVVSPRRYQIAHGYNGFPRGVLDTSERLNDRSTKYRLMQHAERNALDNTTFDLTDGMLVVTKHPCGECAKSIIQKGITVVVCPPILGGDRWEEDAKWAKLIFGEARVLLIDHGDYW